MPDANSHFNPDWAAKSLGTSLAHRCDPNSVLVIPKLLAITLYSCNLVEEYIRPFHFALLQFVEDIDKNAEKSPDAKSIADFVAFSQSLGYQARFQLSPIRQLSGAPRVSEVCRSVADAVAEFHTEVRRIAIEATKDLVAHVFPDLSHHDSDTALNVLQWMTLENRKRQEGVVRVYLDQMQTAARQAHDAVVENQGLIRREAGDIREMLRVAEAICNELGGMKSPATVDAFRSEFLKKTVE